MGPVSPPAPPPAPLPRGFGRGTSSVSAQRHRVVWSGTARSSPSRPMTEPISPSVCRYASRNTALNVSAVRIARSEYSGCPPRLVRRSASHASTASSENQTVTLPRRRRLSSYSRQFVTLRVCPGMLAASVLVQLEGQGGHPGSDGGPPCYLDRAPGATRGIPATTCHRTPPNLLSSRATMGVLPVARQRSAATQVPGTSVRWPPPTRRGRPEPYRRERGVASRSRERPRSPQAAPGA